jgi:magnesium-transporting ATPase (P-type)
MVDQPNTEMMRRLKDAVNDHGVTTTRLTWWLIRLTVAITVFTIIMVALVVLQVLITLKIIP